MNPCEQTELFIRLRKLPQEFAILIKAIEQVKYAFMNNEQFQTYSEIIRQQILALQQEKAKSLEEINRAIEHLLVLYQQAQTSLEEAEQVQEELRQQNQQLSEMSQYFYDLFQFSPIASLVTDANGMILEANSAIALLLNVPQYSLLRRSLTEFVAERDRPAFQTQLQEMAHKRGVQVAQLTLCPQDESSLPVGIQMDAVRNDQGGVETLRIGLYAIDPARTRTPDAIPPSLDGLQVLVVDDQTDAREFITAILEQSGIRVRAVESAEAALTALEDYRPDVLISDIRMPGSDGYRLIEQIREIETQQGRHLPAAAITAYIDEDQEKAIAAGFEAFLHKLAQPSEFIQVVARLAGRSSDGEIQG